MYTFSVCVLMVLPLTAFAFAWKPQTQFDYRDQYAERQTQYGTCARMSSLNQEIATEMGRLRCPQLQQRAHTGYGSTTRQQRLLDLLAGLQQSPDTQCTCTTRDNKQVVRIGFEKTVHTLNMTSGESTVEVTLTVAVLDGSLSSTSSIKVTVVLNTTTIAVLVFREGSKKEPLPLILPVGVSHVLLTADFRDLNNDVIIYPPLAEINVVEPAKRIYTDCLDALEGGETTSGNYTIHPDEGPPLEVYCDQETDGGGWIVVQRRVNKTVDFKRNWDAYKDGFGNLPQGGSGWLGLTNIRRLVMIPTASRTELRVDLGKGKPNKDLYETAYAKYGNFSIDDSNSNYKLTVSDYSGTAGDSLILRHSGREFSTLDHDNDEWYANCALYFGGWWYSNCYAANPNGRYADTNTLQGIRWESWQTEQDKSLAFIEMKLRRVHEKLIFKYYA